MHKVTIIIPTYNSSATIVDCLNSIKYVAGSALGDSIFVLICDGKSTDNSISLIDEMKLPGLSIHSGKDSGVYDAMNKGIKMSKSEWVYFLGSDDCLLPGFLKIVDELNCLGTIYYGDVELSSNNQVYGGAFSKVKLIIKNINHQSIFYPRNILLSEPFELKYKLLSDWNTNIKLFDKFKYKPFLIAKYNNVTGLSSTNVDSTFMADKVSIIKRNMTFPFYFFAIIIKILGRLKNEFTV